MADRLFIERIRDAADAFESARLTLLTLVISVALVVMGNSLARANGLVFLCLLLVAWAMRFRARSRSVR